METEKSKKRGRPAQLLQVAELHAFVEFLEQEKSPSDLQSMVLNALKMADFNFDALSEADRVLVKEALKPYREHLKLRLLYDELSKDTRHTEYEEKFIQLYEKYQQGTLGPAEINILKVMCTRYHRFKAHQLDYKDLELYLSRIQKKDAGKKRKAENNRKFELGGGILSLYKVKNDDLLDTNKLLNQVTAERYLAVKLRKSKIYQQIWCLDLTDQEKVKLLFETLNQLTLFKQSANGIKILDLAIQNAEKKLKRNSDSNDNNCVNS